MSRTRPTSWCAARIYTGDRAQPTASAVAISGGVFTAVGDDAAVAGHVGANTRIVDWLGRRVIPGLNDSHMHIIRGATGKGAVGGE